MSVRLVVPAWLFLLSVLLLGGQAHSQPCLGDAISHTRYNVLLVPRLEATQIYQSWAPLLDRIGKDVNACFQLDSAASFADFEQAVAEGRPDFVYFNPYHQVLAHKKTGYIPLVREGRELLTGVLVVHKDSPIREAAELEGRPIAFPAPNALAASLLPRAMLDREGIRFQPAYLGSHSNVYRAVALGQIDAGAGAANTLDREPESLRANLRLLSTTQSYPGHPLAAHPRIPASVRQAVLTAFRKLGQSKAGRQALAAIQMPNPVAADYRRDYQGLEKLGLERYVE